MEELLEEKEVGQNVNPNVSHRVVAGIEAFHRFTNCLAHGETSDRCYQVASARITSYTAEKIRRFRATILLINQGVNEGRIWIDDGQEGFSEENELLSSRNRKYSLGRTGRELVVETLPNECRIHRVDLEEF
jgi:hypothetical protein